MLDVACPVDNINEHVRSTSTYATVIRVVCGDPSAALLQVRLEGFDGAGLVVGHRAHGESLNAAPAARSISRRRWQVLDTSGSEHRLCLHPPQSGESGHLGAARLP